MKLLTFGGLMVWALIDLILLLLNQTSDADGRPIRVPEARKMQILIVTGAVLVIYLIYIIWANVTQTPA